MKAQVIKLDRGFPLVRTEAGEEYRSEHATALVKEEDQRAVIGDWVEVSVPDDHDKAIIETILPRTNQLIRKDPTEQALPQVLAANFDIVLVTQPISDINIKRLERELVLAHETGAAVAVVLSKSDLAKDASDLAAQVNEVQELVGDNSVIAISQDDEASVEAVRTLIGSGRTAVLIGKSGVGKSSLINLLVGREVQETALVREGDGRGRHTTVSREIIDIPGGGRVVDMPGVRGLGLWDAEAGIEAAFADIEAYTQQCKFSDCSHTSEPGCAVLAAVEAGDIALARLESYRNLVLETQDMRKRRDEAARMNERSPYSRKRHRS